MSVGMRIADVRRGVVGLVGGIILLSSQSSLTHGELQNGCKRGDNIRSYYNLVVPNDPDAREEMFKEIMKAAAATEYNAIFESRGPSSPLVRTNRVTILISAAFRIVGIWCG